MTPRLGKTYLFCFSQQLSHLRLGPLKGPGLASCIDSGTTAKQGHREVCRPRLRGSRTPSRKIDNDLDCGFVKKHSFTQKSQQNRIE